MLGSRMRGQTELLMAGSLRDLVPDDHVLARVDRVLDLSWLRAERDGKQTGRYKKVCLTDPDATMTTNARNRRLEPAYKQHTAVDDALGVILEVEVTTGQANEGDHILPGVDAVAAVTGTPVQVVTADQGYAYGKVYGGLEVRGIDPVIPAKKEPIRSRVPLRRFRYDARHDILKCPMRRILRLQRRVEHGRYFYSRATDCRRCPIHGDCLSKGRVNKAVVVSDHHPALLRARRRKERWSTEDARLYQRHRWRSEGFHGEAKSWHGLARAVRRGLQNMRIQAFLTAARSTSSGSPPLSSPCSGQGATSRSSRLSPGSLRRRLPPRLR